MTTRAHGAAGSGRRPWLPPPALLLLLGAYAALASLTGPFTWPARFAVALPGAVLVATALGKGWHRPGPLPSPPADRAGAGGLLVWAVLIGVTVAFQLLLFASEPRATYPTISSLAALAFGWPGARALALALWLVLGWYLLER